MEQTPDQNTNKLETLCVTKETFGKCSQSKHPYIYFEAVQGLAKLQVR